MVNLPGRLSRNHHGCKAKQKYEVREQKKCEIIAECKRVAEFYKVEPDINENCDQEHEGVSDE